MRDVVLATAVLTAAFGGAWFLSAPTDEASVNTANVNAAVVAPEATPVPAELPAPVVVADVPFPPVMMPPLPLARPERVSEEDAMARLLVAELPSVRAVSAGVIELDGTLHLLEGVDAPAVGQTCRTPAGGLWACGEDARRALASLIDGRTVHCEQAGGALTSRCTVGGQDVSAWLVSEGWALADAKLAPTEDRVAEAAAKADAKGLWAGWFERPADWRERNAVADDLRLVLTETDNQA